MAKRYITQDILKKNTLADIFIFILNKKQTTRREIEYETGFSWGTVSANVSLLIEKGYVTEEKSEQSSVGITSSSMVSSETPFISSRSRSASARTRSVSVTAVRRTIVVHTERLRQSARRQMQSNADILESSMLSHSSQFFEKSVITVFAALQ